MPNTIYHQNNWGWQRCGIPIEMPWWWKSFATGHFPVAGVVGSVGCPTRPIATKIPALLHGGPLFVPVIQPKQVGVVCFFAIATPFVLMRKKLTIVQCHERGPLPILAWRRPSRAAAWLIGAGFRHWSMRGEG